jgi:hypothetical protein
MQMRREESGDGIRNHSDSTAPNLKLHKYGDSQSNSGLFAPHYDQESDNAFHIGPNLNP